MITVGWPTLAQTAARLQAEAEALAGKLGHSLSGWTQLIGRRSAARCMACDAMTWVYVRMPSEAPIQGSAVQFRCARR